ncbi:MAG: hypothetical protein IJA32_13395 [Lachnospiraceae bacterium]|nr:hypothetical protein [Lachnospiraceae bacterium]
MKKYLKMLPLIIYPYAYIIWFLGFVEIGSLLEETVSEETLSNTQSAVAIVYQIVVLVNVIWGTIAVAVNGYTAREAAKLNLAVKGFQIPAYIFYFIVGLVGCVMSIWGIGLIILSLVVNGITIILTGIYAVGCIVKMRRQNAISTAMAIVSGICSFVYVADVIVAFILSRKCKKNELYKVIIIED